MDFYQLKIFQHLAASLNYTKTAAHFALSQSSITRIIQKLEDEMSQQLFVRDNKKVMLTVFGNEFELFAERCLIELSRIKIKIQGENEENGGTLILYASVTATYTLLTDLIKRFRIQYPGISLQLYTGDAANAISHLKAGKVDIAVAAIPENLPKSIVYKIVAESPLTLIAPAYEISEINKIKKKQDLFTKYQFILPGEGLARKYFDKWCRRYKLKPSIYSEVSGHEAIISLVSLGCGIGLIPEIVLEMSPLKDEVNIITGIKPIYTYKIGFCTHMSMIKTPIVKKFWDII